MQSKINFLILFFFVSLVFSCKKADQKTGESQHKNISITLTKKTRVGPFSRLLYPFARVKDIPKDLKNIPQADTLVVQMLRLYSLKKLEKMLEDKVIDTSTFKRFQYGVYGVSGFENGKQFFIVDVNNNKDFSDDQKYIYDKEYRILARKDRQLRDSIFPILTLKHQDFKHGKIVDRQSYIRVFPYKDYFNYKNPTPEIERYLDLHIVGQFNEYWESKIENENKSYKIAIQKDQDRIELLLAEEGQPFKPKQRGMYYRKYKLGDTLDLDKSYYSIDSLSPRLDKLYLTTVSAPSIRHGYKAGDIITDFNVETLNGEQTKLSTLLESKDYLLLDFWGTWCGPCKELTPDLKAIHQNMSHVGILGVAYDFKKEPVVEYVEKHRLDWTQIYEPRIRKDSLPDKKIVGKLKVDLYPTYILINKDRQILFRGIGKDALKIIRGIIQ